MSHPHWWITVDNGMAIECDKCDAYANRENEEDFIEREKRQDCPVSDEQFQKKQIKAFKNKSKMK